MAKPQLLQQLRHGKLLTKENFPLFVETFNYAVNRLENIKGDADVDPQTGKIKFDTTDPEHPVIRLGDIEGDCDCPPLDEVSLSTYSPEPEEGEDPGPPSACIMGWHNLSTEQADTDAISGYGFVARDEETNELKYIGLNFLSSLSGGGGGGDMVLDNVSLSTNSNEEACIKGWLYDSAEGPTGELSDYAFVARDKDNKLKYILLSALGSLSAQGNTPLSAGPVDCNGKLLKFGAGLSTNLSVEVAENAAGVVDVKIGVYYI